MARDRLPELLDRELAHGADEVRVVQETIDMRDLAGPEMRAQRRAFAELLSDSPPGSRAYYSQMRNIERWARGRRPKLVSIQRIETARRQQSERLTELRARGAAARMRISFYGARRPENVPAHNWLRMPREVMRRVARTWARGDLEGAAEDFRAEFYARYGVPNVADWIRDVAVLELELAPGSGGL